jgi:hypothetical protein
MSRGGEDRSLVVRLPDEPPSLNREAARALLGILVELTEVPVLDGPGEGGPGDR